MQNELEVDRAKEEEEWELDSLQTSVPERGLTSNSLLFQGLGNVLHRCWL